MSQFSSEYALSASERKKMFSLPSFCRRGQFVYLRRNPFIDVNEVRCMLAGYFCEWGKDRVRSAQVVTIEEKNKSYFLSFSSIEKKIEQSERSIVGWKTRDYVSSIDVPKTSVDNQAAKNMTFILGTHG